MLEHFPQVYDLPYVIFLADCPLLCDKLKPRRLSVGSPFVDFFRPQPLERPKLGGVNVYKTR